MLFKQSFFQQLRESSKSDLIVSVTKPPGETEVHSFFAHPTDHINYYEKGNVSPDSPIRKMKSTKSRNKQENVGIGKTLSEHPEINRQIHLCNEDDSDDDNDNDSSDSSEDDSDSSSDNDSSVEIIEKTNSSPSKRNSSKRRKKLTQVNLSHSVKHFSNKMSTLSCCCNPINFPDSYCYNRSEESNHSSDRDFSSSIIPAVEI